jgi:hypothetical protein
LLLALLIAHFCLLCLDPVAGTGYANVARDFTFGTPRIARVFEIGGTDITG